MRVTLVLSSNPKKIPYDTKMYVNDTCFLLIIKNEILLTRIKNMVKPICVKLSTKQEEKRMQKSTPNVLTALILFTEFYLLNVH